MSGVYFADSFYFIALLNPDDRSNKAVWEFNEQYRGRIITTEYVLLEVANALTAPKYRTNTARFIKKLYEGEDVNIIPASHHLLSLGLSLYQERDDKNWSLTDCISFIVMERENITEALTGDRHFQQAGFKAVFT